MALVLRQTVIDCLDPSAVAAFWGDALGWEVKHEETYLWMSESGADDSFGAVLVFVPVPEPKAGKNRVHIDLAVRRSNQATEVARLLKLGAVPVDVGQGDRPWVVLADPEGNEFCVEPVDLR
ncbi:MAG: VOC family protein [Acidimicrobiales bacterium]